MTESKLLREERALLWSAVGAARSAVTITNAREPDNPIVYCNPAFLALTGYKHADTLGRNCRFLQGPNTNKDTVEELRDALAHGEEVHVRILNYRRDGSPFWNDLVISPVFSEHRELTHFIGLQSDATGTQDEVVALRRSEVALARSNRELIDYVAYAMSNDILRSIDSIVGDLEYLEGKQTPELDDEGRSRLGSAADASRRVQAFVRDLILFSRARSRVADLCPADLNLDLRDVRSHGDLPQGDDAPDPTK